MSKPASTARQLTGYTLHNHLRRLRLREHISHLQAYLFLELVAICNDEGWPTEFSATNGTLQAGLGCSEEGLIKARLRLQEVGLIDFVSGNRRTPTRYRFLAQGSGELSHSPAKGSGELSDSAFNDPGEDSGELSNLTQKGSGELSNETIKRANGSAQGSGEDSGELSPYKEQTKTKTLFEGESVSASLSFEQSASQPVTESISALQDVASTTTLPATQPRADRTTRKRGAAAPAIPAELLPEACPLADLLNPGGLAAKVQQMVEPLTLAEAEKLLLEYGASALRTIFCEMANYSKLLTNSASANLTARNWLNRRRQHGGVAEPLPIATAAVLLTPEPNQHVVAEREARKKEAFRAHLAQHAVQPANE